ncbi:NAD(P)-binding protein [Calocera viscosa TUFC12733]|uniref:NAD(P)-binding protein n=1 Tax=Calocera viscosa (strain TUFC12733) TaxID=1330018 RepID=A0A167RUR7_CALVF|nr:NAD(P)-binding protein [Calocera viscosa TUFC12733]
MAPSVWLITGASSGFGRIMAELVLANGDICIATSIDPPALADLVPKYDKEQLMLLETDVTKIQDIALAFKTAEQTYGHIDVVVNNAGVVIAAEVEGTPDVRARHMFEVNFWGSANVTREAIRFFREVNGPRRGGKLLQMTSMLAIAAWPGLSYYSVEGLTKSLVEELDPAWNIQVMMIEPGLMRTPILDSLQASRIDVHPAYVGGAADRTRLAMQPKQASGDPQKAMGFVYNVARMDKLPLHLPVGPDAIEHFKRTIDDLTKAFDEWESLASLTVFTD